MRRITPDQLQDARRDPVDASTLAEAQAIIDAVRAGGDAALRAQAERFGELKSGDPLILDRACLQRALQALPRTERALLERTAARIEGFASAQLASLSSLDVAIPGGRAGHTIAPVERAGCYAPGGRYPLPSSVLMTAVTARVAGVSQILVASPRPAPATLAAAAVAGADALLPLGGAHAIAALAWGSPSVEPVDVIVGPGNRWVTAAKQLATGRVGIDMLAGPSELAVLADHTASPAVVAADLLAQAEHDPDARPYLITWHAPLIDAVAAELDRQLATLPTAATARLAVAEGAFVLCATEAEAVAVCNRLAPEHLEVLTEDPDATARHLTHYGGLFLGNHAAEVLGDYGVGPNHVLPTGSTARFTGGLSVFDFLRVRTWMRMSPGPALQAVATDAAALARIEGLEGHARSAEQRLDAPAAEAGPSPRPPPDAN